MLGELAAASCDSVVMWSAPGTFPANLDIFRWCLPTLTACWHQPGYHNQPSPNQPSQCKHEPTVTVSERIQLLRWLYSAGVHCSHVVHIYFIWPSSQRCENLVSVLTYFYQAGLLCPLIKPSTWTNYFGHNRQVLISNLVALGEERADLYEIRSVS